MARRGGHRVFVRVQKDDHLIDDFRVVGFVPCGGELLYKGRRGASNNGRPGRLRKKLPEDDYNLFRLYNASTPLEVRCVVGMTFDQWMASRERSRRRCREVVWEENGQVRGWLRAVPHSGVTLLLAMVPPEEKAVTAELLDFGLSSMCRTDMVLCLVPGHQAVIANLLERRGFAVVGEYATLVRSMVTVVREKARRAVKIVPT